MPVSGHSGEQAVNPEHCPQVEKHTPAPRGYLEWHEWAEKKSKTHRQIRCLGCNLWVIWVPKVAKEALRHAG